MEQVILAGFDGKKNPARMIVEGVKVPCNKLILPNDRDKSAQLLLDEIERISAVCVVMLGQKPGIIGRIAVEPAAKGSGHVLRTSMDCASSVNLIKSKGYEAYISKGCGNSYCNHIYYECLKTGVNCIFLHVPVFENIPDMSAIISVVEGYIEGLSGVPAML